MNKSRRLQAASGAENLVDLGAEAYQRERRVQQGQGVLQGFRQQAERLRDDELDRAMKSLANGADPKETLQKLANGLTNKLIHPTTAAIRNASADGRADRLDFIQEAYGLKHSAAEDGAGENHSNERKES